MSLIRLFIWTTLKPLLAKNETDDIAYPTHPVSCMITGPSESGKPYFSEPSFEYYERKKNI